MVRQFMLSMHYPIRDQHWTLEGQGHTVMLVIKQDNPAAAEHPLQGSF